MLKILYVENEPAIAELVRRRLVMAGHEVVIATDGVEAIETAVSERPDLILMDINLGEFSCDGFEANRLLKDNVDTRSIPVIALTAHAQHDEQRQRAMREGFVEHLSKPIDFAQLLEKARAFTGNGEPT